MSKSDPYVTVSIRDSKSQHYSMIGKTEVVMNNLNPDFTKFFTIDYYFERE